jgi:hypothetical protein
MDKKECCKTCVNYIKKMLKIKQVKKKCVLCEKDIDWEHHLFPLPYVMYDLTLIERFCPTCWDRIWAEWYRYYDDTEFYDLTYEYPTDEYIIAKYKGNDLVAKIERESPTRKVPGSWTKPIKNKKPKKKHWWSK